MLKTVKINIVKVVSMLLAMVVLLSIPESAAEAANCTTGHHYDHTSTTTTSSTLIHYGPWGECTITTIYNVYNYSCQKSPCTAKFQEIGGIKSASHSSCK